MIYLRAEGGLCNRLRAINSAFVLSQKTGHGLSVLWKTDPEMNCNFSDLFMPVQNFGVKDIGREGFWTHLFFSPRNFLMHLPARGEEMVRCIAKRPSFWIWSKGAYTEFYRPEHPNYSWLKPRPLIAAEIERHRALIGPNAIALHIRRTDNKMSIRMSPLSLFREKIEAHLKANAHQRFFVATDDEATKDELKGRYGACIYMRDQVARRDAATGVQDAVVDLFLLAGCTRLYGSYQSSFSDVAADIGNTPYERLISGQ